MKRHKPLVSVTPLIRRTPMERGTADLKRSPLKPVSPMRRQENRERRALVVRLWPDGRPQCVVPWCPRPADDLHEPLTRARGGSITDPDNAVPVCRPCHDWIGAEPVWAYQLDLLVPSWDPRSLAQQAADRKAKLAAWRPGPGEAA